MRRAVGSALEALNPYEPRPVRPGLRPCPDARPDRHRAECPRCEQVGGQYRGTLIIQLLLTDRAMAQVFADGRGGVFAELVIQEVPQDVR